MFRIKKEAAQARFKTRKQSHIHAYIRTRMTQCTVPLVWLLPRRTASYETNSKQQLASPHVQVESNQQTEHTNKTSDYTWQKQQHQKGFFFYNAKDHCG